MSMLQVEAWLSCILAYFLRTQNWKVQSVRKVNLGSNITGMQMQTGIGSELSTGGAAGLSRNLGPPSKL